MRLQKSVDEKVFFKSIFFEKTLRFALTYSTHVVETLLTVKILSKREVLLKLLHSGSTLQHVGKGPSKYIRRYFVNLGLLIVRGRVSETYKLSLLLRTL